MPLDAVCISALCAELENELTGARIDKVQQPERDLLILSVRTKSGNRKLLIAAAAGSARVHLTSETMENPAEPPMFCMLLRKHLMGARIAAVSQPDHERMLTLALDSRDEMGDLSRKSLIVEMIGRSSNVILVGPDGRIIDCLRRSDFTGDELRRMQPGMIYRLPPKQDKTDFFASDAAARRELIASADRSIPPDRWLLSHFSGLSPLICRELSFRSGEDYERLPAQTDAFFDLVSAGDFRPVMLTEEGRPLDFSFLSVQQYGSRAETLFFDSFSELLDAFYARREREERQRRRSHDLMRTVRTARDRLQRKLALQKEEYRRTADREQIRKNAELLTANLYRLKKGARELVCEDYFEPDCPEIRIPLDPLKSPQQNAAGLYREYNRQKAAEAHLRELIREGEQQLDYLNSVLDEIERAEGEKDLGELRRELTETGYLKKQKAARQEKNRPHQPFRYLSDDGLEILVGRSNLQNDELSFRQARRTDYWLHTQKIHGSHVIVRCEGLEPPERTLQQAASLAAFHSQGRAGGRIPVDCTMLRFVRKPSGALPGKVIYTDYRTIMAEADESLAERLRKKP